MSNKIALVSLDFAGTGSMCGANKGVGGDGCAISRNNNQDLSDRNPQPARQGRGYRTRSGRLRGSGFHEKGLEVALDMEQLLYEATTLLNAASLINRIGQQS